MELSIVTLRKFEINFRDEPFVAVLNPDSAVEREVMSKEQTFRSEDMPFGIANGKSQIPKYGICNLRREIPSVSEDKLLQVCPSLTF